MEQNIISNSRPKFSCPFCDKVHNSESGFRSHMKDTHGRVHTGKGDTKCPECDYTSSEHGVIMHRSKAHGIPGRIRAARANTERAFPCSYCSFIARKKAGLTRHLHQQHPLETGFARLREAKPSVSQKQNGSNQDLTDKIVERVAEKIYRTLVAQAQ